MANQSTQLTIPSLPEGWTGTPDEFLQWLAANATFESTGESLGGQFGGSRPTSNVGIYVNGRAVEVWDSEAGKYVPISNVPIGACLPYFGTSATVPDDYALCDGSELVKGDFADLWTILTATDDQRRRSGDSSLSFRVPDLRGRIPMGAGAGVYYGTGNNPVGAGVMDERTLGQVEGAESILRGPLHTGAPSLMRDISEATIVASKKNYIAVSPPSSNANWIIRKQ